MTTRNRFTLLHAGIMSAVLCFSDGARAASHIWSLATGSDGASLIFGAPNSPEETDIVFSCDKRGKNTRVFVAETDERFKPKQRAKAALSVGAIETTVAGRFVPNEDAGVASFEGELSPDDPVFEALRGTNRLTIAIGSWKRSFGPLGDNDKAGKFAAACRKGR